MKNITILWFGILLFVGAMSCGSGAATTAQLSSGAENYKKYCVACHGEDGGMMLNGAKDLRKSEMTHAERVHIITNGKGLMTPFGEILSKDEVEAVAHYTFELEKVK